MATTVTQSPNRLLGAVFGVVYLLIGIVGFFITPGVDFAGTEGVNLIIFEINPLHNIVHLGVGAALLIASLSGVAASKGVNIAVGAVYLLVGVLGLFILDSALNILALNAADNVLHLASAAILLIVGLSQDKSVSARVA